MKTYRILNWDSNFFGFKVATIVPNRIIYSDLKQILKRLKEKKVSLVYWCSDPKSRNSQIAAKELGGFLVDFKITYEINLNTYDDQGSFENLGVEKYSKSTPNKDLENLAIQSGLYSRFRVDPNFTQDHFESLYKTWIRNSINKKIADEVLVMNKDGSINGMITVMNKNGKGMIGLMAVDSRVRAKGLGTILINAAKSWFISRGCQRGMVVTQRKNKAACKLYEKCGFYVRKVENFYHFWLMILAKY